MQRSMHRYTAPSVLAGLAAVTIPALSVRADFALYGSQVTDSSPSQWGLIQFDTGPITGASTRVGHGGLMFDFDFSPTGVLYSPRGDDLWTVDTESGLQTRIGDFGIIPIITSIAFSPDGTLFGTDNEGTATSLYRINTLTGRATRIGPVGEYVFGLDFSPDGVLYGASGSIFTINPSTGAHGPDIFGFGPFITALDYGTDGIFRGAESASGADRLWEIDLEAHQRRLIGPSSETEIYGLASIPAPTTLTVTIAVTVAGLCRRR